MCPNWTDGEESTGSIWLSRVACPWVRSRAPPGGDSAMEGRKWNEQLNRLTTDKNERYDKENDRACVHQRKNIEGNITNENQTIGRQIVTDMGASPCHR